MLEYVVSLYDSDNDSFVFTCFADDEDHAKEQAENAYPSAYIAEVYRVDDHNTIPSARKVKQIISSLDEVKRAVDAGLVVYADVEGYQVLKEGNYYYIKHRASDYVCGLHGLEGTPYEHIANAGEFFTLKHI
jgi:hypothetical protein